MSACKFGKSARLLVILLLARPFGARAQNAELHGSVHGSSGSAISGATIEFRNQDTGIRREAVSMQDGSYRIDNMDSGHYDAIVQARGFKTLTLADIDVQSDRSSRVDFQLETDVSPHAGKSSVFLSASHAGKEFIQHTAPANRPVFRLSRGGCAISAAAGAGPSLNHRNVTAVSERTMNARMPHASQTILL